MTRPSWKYPTVEGVTNLLHNLKPHKATGPDSIPAYFLKILSHEITQILTNFSIILVPRCTTCRMEVIPILIKKGDCTKINNYWPVSLTSICSKILEHIVYTCIFSNLKEHKILREEQHGVNHVKLN